MSFIFQKTDYFRGVNSENKFLKIGYQTRFHISLGFVNNYQMSA